VNQFLQIRFLRTGHVSLGKDERLAVLKQDHFAYEDERVLDVVIKVLF
jgi:ATPase subunit of ABC transporter with duplicated ATPase domains